MRAFAKSKWALVLFGLLIVSFGIFGLRDNFSGMGGGGLIQVGSREITPIDVQREVDREIDRVRTQEGEALTAEQALARGIPQRELGQLQYLYSLLAYADSKGIRASSQAVANLVLHETNLFKDSLGRVNIDAIRKEASERGMDSIKRYEEFLRDILTAQYVEEAYRSAVITPNILTQPFVKYMGESRTLTVARLKNDAIPPPKMPTDAELQTWYDAHKTAFQQPERRRISVLSYSPADHLDEVQITDAQVKADYEKRIRDFSSPETREITEFSSDNDNAVQELIDLTQQAIPWEDAVKRVQGLTRTDKTVKSEGGTPAETIDHEGYHSLVFSLEAGKMHTSMLRLEGKPAFAVIVRKITPGVPKPFADVAETIRHDLAMPDAVRLFDAKAEAFDDAAGGQTLESIAKQFGVPVVQLAPVDGRGQMANGEVSKLLAMNPSVLRDMANIQVGAITQVYQGEGARTMYRLDEVVAPYTLPFDQVKNDVKIEYLKEVVEKSAEKIANEMVAAVKAGKPFEQAAAASKLATLPQFTTTRDGGGDRIDPQALEFAFEQPIGEVSMVRGSTGEPWVIRVDKSEPAPPQMAAILKAQYGSQVTASLQRDIVEVFNVGLANEAPAKQDEVAIGRYLKTFNPTEDQ